MRELDKTKELTVAQKKSIIRRAADNIEAENGQNYDQRIMWDKPYFGGYHPTCGSVGCLHGHLIHAAKQLGITTLGYGHHFLPGTDFETKIRSRHLFAPNVVHWPEIYKREYYSALSYMPDIPFLAGSEFDAAVEIRGNAAVHLLRDLADGKIWPWPTNVDADANEVR